MTSGTIDSYDSGGAFVRTILQPTDRNEIGERPFSTAHRSASASDRTVFHPEVGVVVAPGRIGPGENTGTVPPIVFDGSGGPGTPETMADGLPFPDGIGVYVPRSRLTSVRSKA